MKSLENKITSNPTITFQEILQLSSNDYDKSLEEGDVFLIGPYIFDPVRQVQRAYHQNQLISIVVLIFPHQFQKIKQQILFSYNIGKNVTYVSYETGKDLTGVLDGAITRTHQRKSFLRIKEQQSSPVPANHEITFGNLGFFLQNAPIGV